MRTALMIVGLLVSLAAQPQDIYRWVDKDGIVHYADQPGSPDAELVPFPGMDVAEAGADSTGEAPRPEDQPGEPPADSAYGSMTIISPSPEAVFYGTDVSVPVQVALDADLRPGDTLVVFVDGQRTSEVSGLAATLTGLTRGTHLLQVWYLAGTFGGPAERWVEVPTGTALLFPLINYDLWSPEDCWWIGASIEPEPCSASDLQAFLNDFFTNHVTGLSATLDGEEIPNLLDYRATSGPFTLPIDPDTLWTDFGYTPGPRYPNVSDGYYVLLRPLRPGEHVWTFSADIDNNPSQAVTYHLTVTGAR